MTCITISLDYVENREIEIYFFLTFFFYDEPSISIFDTRLS